MRRIHAGQLDTRLSIEMFRTDAEENSHGEIDYSDPSTFEAVGERWARFETGGGLERAAQDLVQAGITHRVVMRYDSLTSRIVPSWRLRKGTRAFGVITTGNVDEKREWIELGVVEALGGPAN